MFNDISSDPLKVKNWNNPDKPETRLDYCLSVFEGGHWIQLGIEITQNGNTQFIKKYNCQMP